MKQKLIEILRTKEARIQEEKARYSPNPASNFTHLTGNANGNTTFIDAIERKNPNYRKLLKMLHEEQFRMQLYLALLRKYPQFANSELNNSGEERYFPDLAITGQHNYIGEASKRLLNKNTK